MASLRRNKTLSPDGQTARFLYTIIKQLDLKSIDWNLVAGSLDITNGHAARMRYSRFKQHMEGQTTQPRAPKAGNKDKEKEGKEREKEGKEGQKGVKKGKKRCFGEEEDKKKMTASCLNGENGLNGAVIAVKTEGGGKRIKNEPCTAPCAAQVKSEPDSSVRPTVVALKREEPDVDDFANPDIWRILPHSATGHGITLHDQTPRSMISSPTSLPTTQTIPPPHTQLQQQPTVSLADLEVSPLSRPSAGPAVPRCNFFESRGNTVHIKAEPRPDGAWTVLAGPSARAVVKREPVEA